MKIFGNKQRKRTIDNEIDHVISVLESKDPGSDEYEKAVKNLYTLCEARSFRGPSSISMDTVLTGLIGSGQILMMMNHERLHVIATKAISWVLKSKI